MYVYVYVYRLGGASIEVLEELVQKGFLGMVPNLYSSSKLAY